MNKIEYKNDNNTISILYIIILINNLFNIKTNDNKHISNIKMNSIGFINMLNIILGCGKDKSIGLIGIIYYFGFIL